MLFRSVAVKQQEGLQCLAKNTGGLFLAAKNANELNSALKQAVTAIKEQPKKVVAKPAPKAKPAPAPIIKPAPKPKKVVEPGHWFSAILSEGDDPVTRDMRWDIYQAKQDANGKRKHIKGTYNAKPKFVLNAGKYLIVAKYGSAVQIGRAHV